MSKQIKNTSNKPLVEKDVFNYAMPALHKLYSEIQPNTTTVSTNNIIYFNSNEEVDDNAYCEKLLDLYTNASATHSSLINLKRNMLIGNGLEPIKKDDQAAIEFINQNNSYGESLQDIWSKMCLDFAIFESYGLEINYNRNGKIQEILHICPNLIRAVANSINPNIPSITQWMLSYNWSRISNRNYRRYTVATSGIPIANYNPDKWASDGGKQLLYVKKYTGGNIPYAIPSYNSILPYVQLDAALSTYNLNSVKKGFTPQTIVNLPGAPTEEEKQQFINKFKQRYSTEDGERLLFLWFQDKDNMANIQAFNELDNTAMVKLLNDVLTQKIASGHNANLELAGIQGTGGQSLQADANKIAVSYNYFYTSVIQPMQKVMLEGINKIMKFNGLSEVTVVTPPLALETPQPQAAAVPQANNPNIIQ